MEYSRITQELEKARKNRDIDGYIGTIRDMLRRASDFGLDFIEG